MNMDKKYGNIAEKEGLTPQEYVDEMAIQAKKLWSYMDIKYDDFIRTTEDRHTRIAQKIFDIFLEKGDI